MIDLYLKIIYLIVAKTNIAHTYTFLNVIDSVLKIKKIKIKRKNVYAHKNIFIKKCNNSKIVHIKIENKIYL